ncbi:MAG: hypothetical protein E7050_11665 [Lentisphaerae bacterium]|nr:hypothetical protein [Lentisphaerota bacterium]
MEKHSNLLRRFASGKLNLFSALKILKVLLKDIEDENLISWVEREMNGYDVSDPDIPSYRKAKGCIMGNIITFNMITRDQMLPTDQIPEDQREALQTVIIDNGVVALSNIVKTQDGILARFIPPEYYHWFNNVYDNASVTHVQTRVDHSIPANVLSNIESKVLDIFYLLEQKGCNIDEMDVSEIKSQQQNIVTLIKELVYSDNRITIGDDNEFAKTTLQTQCKQ